MNDILIPIAVANLISEQKIVRDLVNRLYDPTNYLKFTGIKRFTYDLLSCWVCLSFHTTWIYLLLKQEPDLIQYIYIPLTNMLIVDVIQKIKR